MGEGGEAVPYNKKVLHAPDIFMFGLDVMCQEQHPISNTLIAVKISFTELKFKIS